MGKHIKKHDTPDLSQTLTPQLLGQAVKARRTQSHLTLEDAAALCGVAKQTLLNIEHGHANSQLVTVLQICAALGLALHILPWHQPQGDADDWQ